MTHTTTNRSLKTWDLNTEDLKEVDAVVSLAAVSNDPGNDFENATIDINYKANLDYFNYVWKVVCKN